MDKWGKRNYNQYSDIDSKIIQLYNKQYSVLEIRQAISSEFDLQLEETENKIKDVLMSVHSENGLKMKYIKENPGFLIEITPNGREYVVGKAVDESVGNGSTYSPDAKLLSYSISKALFTSLLLTVQTPSNARWHEWPNDKEYWPVYGPSGIKELLPEM